MIQTRFSNRERALILITTAVVASTLFYGFIIEPLINAYSKIDRQIASGALKLERNNKLIRRSDIINNEYKKYRALIKPSLSEEEAKAGILKTIESIARACNMYISNIRPQPVRTLSFYKELSFELVGEASIDNLVKFIYDIQKSGNLLRVSRLTLTSRTSKKDTLKSIILITHTYIK